MNESTIDRMQSDLAEVQAVVARMSAALSQMRREGAVSADFGKKSVDLREASKQLSMSETSVRRLIWTGRLKKAPGIGKIIIPVEELNAYLRS